MNEFDGLVRELIYELLGLDLDELAELRKEWNADMTRKKMPDNVVAFCNKLVDLMIENKMEKVGA
ncbi:hypothetical protein [Phocaeicola sp.]|uniref:hypothetical protein n=1 Tax=Phocaeicola sp. TaxID=2773926 RepID=UPI003A924E31